RVDLGARQFPVATAWERQHSGDDEADRSILHDPLKGIPQRSHDSLLSGMSSPIMRPSATSLLVWFWPVNIDRAPFALARGRRNHCVVAIAAGSCRMLPKTCSLVPEPSTSFAPRHWRQPSNKRINEQTNENKQDPKTGARGEFCVYLIDRAASGTQQHA